MIPGRWPVLLAATFLALAAFAAGVYLSRPISPPAQTSLSADAAARLFAATFSDTAGTPRALGEWRGRPLIVNFWATWCPPCLREMPLLTRIQADHPEIRIVGIAADVDTNVLEFAAKNNVGYPLLLGAQGAFQLMTELGNHRQALPYTVALNAEGNPVAAILGGLDEASAQQILAQLTQRR